MDEEDTKRFLDGLFPKDQRCFAFFSAKTYLEERQLPFVLRHDDDFFTDPAGLKVRANYVGGMVDGYPGCLRNGTVIRPHNHESYKLLGEVRGPVRGKLMPPAVAEKLGCGS